MLIRKLAVRAARTHRLRTLLTIASIVIGVACVVAVDLASDSARRSYAAMSSAVGGRASLEVTAPGGGTVPEHLAAAIADTPGVDETVAILQRPTVLYPEEGDRVRLILQGVDWVADPVAADFDLVDGAGVTDSKGTLLDADFAERMNLSVGDTVKILSRRGLVTFDVAGLVRPHSGGALRQGASMFVTLSAAQRRFAAQDAVDEIQIVLDESSRDDPQRVTAVADAIRPLLPPEADVHPPASRGQFAEETLLSFESGVRMATSFSLLAAVFIIANTFLMNVGQRRPQLAMLRAIGATRRQILALIYWEAVMLALIGTALGLLLGWAGAGVLSSAIGRLMQADLPPLRLSIAPFAWATAFGLGISALGVWYPAFRATRVTPREGIGQAGRTDSDGMPSWMVTLGLIGSIAAFCLLLANLQGRLQRLDRVLTAVVLLVAMVPVMALVLQPFSSFAAGLLAWWSRVESRLARRQLLRHRTRTTLTVGVLFVASATGFGLASSLIDNVQDIRRWYRTAIASDFFIRAMMPDLETWSSASIPDNLEPQLREVPGVTTIDTARFVRAQAAGQSVMILAREYPTEDYATFEGTRMSAREIRRRLIRGEVAIGTVLAQRTGLQAGDELELETREGKRKLPIATVVEDYQAGGLTVHMQRDVARRLLGLEGVDVYLIRADHDRLDEVEQRLRAISQPHGLIVQSFGELASMIDTMMAGVVASLWVLLVLGLVVAALGVTNTLHMNVLEQARELAMLRVIAMTRRQVQTMVFAQAFILGLIGILPGIAAGMGLAYLINLSTLKAIGHVVDFRFHPLLAGGGFVVAMLLVIFAAWSPATRATRGNAVEALRAT